MNKIPEWLRESHYLMPITIELNTQMMNEYLIKKFVGGFVYGPYLAESPYSAVRKWLEHLDLVDVTISHLEQGVEPSISVLREDSKKTVAVYVLDYEGRLK